MAENVWQMQPISAELQVLSGILISIPRLLLVMWAIIMETRKQEVAQAKLCCKSHSKGFSWIVET